MVVREQIVGSYPYTQEIMEVNEGGVEYIQEIEDE